MNTSPDRSHHPILTNLFSRLIDVSQPGKFLKPTLEKVLRGIGSVEKFTYEIYKKQ